MDFKFSDEQLAIRAMTRDFVNNEIMPVARMYDEEETIPTPIFDKLR